MITLLTILAIVGSFILFAALVYAVSVQHQVNFERKFEPISDDEFMARLPTGTSREVALKVRRIVANQFNVEFERISPDTSFVNDLGAD